MSSIIKRSKIIKDKFRNVEKITSCKISLEREEDKSIINKNLHYIMNLESNGIFKMLEINYTGKMQSINSKNPNIKINFSEKTKRIIVSNPYQVILQNDILFTFRGFISNFNKVVVFGWGQSHFIPVIEQPSTLKSLIGNDENIIGTSSDKFYG